MKMPTPETGAEDHRQLTEWSIAHGNTTAYNLTDLPIDMRFNDGHVISIIVYTILMVISATGNLTVLVLILQRRKKSKSRINMMLMHLAIADLMVTFLMMPLEIGWAYTVSWEAGDTMCRIMAFFRTFGLYLSSFILVCISCDRYYAVLKPMQFSGIDRRGKSMIAVAWFASTICSAPQMLVFHVEKHPNVTSYEQCITYGSFPSYAHELTYSVFGMVVMYGIPLVVIIYTYSSILLEIFRRSRSSETDFIRRSGLGYLGRAKVRTLKMTIIIVLVFFICWTPYYIMCMWYWYDKESALQVDQRVQKGLFLFACTNSCMNPIVYGVFNIRARRGAAGAQVTEQGNSRNRSNTQVGTTGMDVVCLVSWKKPATAGSKGATAQQVHHRRRDICLSCGESFQLRVAVTGVATSPPPSPPPHSAACK